jgi:hypothetical protein
LSSRKILSIELNLSAIYYHISLNHTYSPTNRELYPLYHC